MAESGPDISEPIFPDSVLRLLRDTLYQWNAGKAYVYAAALAFYTIFSVVPLIIFLVGIAAQVSGSESLETRIVQIVAEEAGAVPADFLENLVAESESSLDQGVATGLGILFLIYAASTIFHQLQNSLNAMYGLPDDHLSLRHGILYFLIARLFSAVVVILMGVFFMVLLIANFIFSTLPPTPLETFMADWPFTQFVIRWILAPALSVGFFTVLYHQLPAGQLRWRDVAPGALLTVGLISVGNKIIGVYLERIFSVSLYGASGTVVLFLVWIYYISLIILFGAKFIALYAERFGVPVEPKRRLLLGRPVR
ncbi:MAG: YihY/virulence factor BrkB family protein [Caldilineaceae bacterium]